MSTTPTAADIVRALFEDLSAWCIQNKGVCGLTKSPYDLFEILKDSPRGWRLTIHWEGEQPVDPETPRGGVSLHRIRLILDGDLGPTAVPGIALIRPTAARTPFLELIDNVRQRMLSYRTPWLRAPNDRFQPLGSDDKVPLPDGLFLAAYNLSFELLAPCRNPAPELLLPV